MTWADDLRTRLGWFLLIFPYSYFQGGGSSIDKWCDRWRGADTMGYILKYIFLWLFMATVVTSCDRRSWFYNTTKPSEWEGAPFGFHKYISVVRFEKSPPLYASPTNPYHILEIYLLLPGRFGINSTVTWIFFVPGRLSCHDDSVSIWTLKWTLPGFIPPPRNSHPYGNDYHYIADGASGKMYAIDIVEGKYFPPQLVQRQFHEGDGTSSLLLHLTKALFGTVNMIILDSSLCVLR